MTVGRVKKNQHRQESDQVNRTAFWIGGAIAVLVLGSIVVSVLF